MTPTTTPPPIPPDVGRVLDTVPKAPRRMMIELRTLIHETAARIDGVGPLTETLKWGEPAYLTQASKSGTTLRLGWKQSASDRISLLFNCNTSLAETYRERFSNVLRIEGSRAVILNLSDDIDVLPIDSCIALALTYHKPKLLQSLRREFA